jgi:hypothetical protein
MLCGRRGNGRFLSLLSSHRETFETSQGPRATIDAASCDNHQKQNQQEPSGRWPLHPPLFQLQFDFLFVTPSRGTE